MLCIHRNKDTFKDATKIVKKLDFSHLKYGQLPLIKITETNSKSKYISIRSIRKHYTYIEPDFQPWMQSWLNIHENQYHAANDIIDHLMCGFKNIILAAQMQSGKTGTIRYLLHILLHLSGYNDSWEERMTADRIYFICGMNDNDLRQQAIREFKGLLSEDSIMFSQQLQSWNRNVPQGQASKVSVIIIDESHYASNRNSQVDKYLKSVNHCNPIIISVSATAMAELAVSEHQGIGVVYLKPGYGYYGIDDMFKEELIFQSLPLMTIDALSSSVINNDFIDLVTNEYDYQRDRCLHKYNIIRLPSQWYYQDLQDMLNELDMDLRFIHYHSQNNENITKDFNELIKHKPDKFTIIWIYGVLRAGKQLNTEHIGFVHDTASSAPDTIAQSLLGRVMGYGKKKNQVKCFTDLKAAKLILEWFKQCYDITKIPQGSRGIIGGYSDKLRRWNLHPPIAVKLDLDTRSKYRTLKVLHGNRYPYKWNLIDDLIESADGTIRSELSRIFTEYQPGPNGGVMVLTENNTRRSFAEHWIGNYIQYTKGIPVRGFNTFDINPGNYFYIYLNLDMSSIQYGMALVTYKEYINSKQGHEHIVLNVKSRFHK